MNADIDKAAVLAALVHRLEAALEALVDAQGAVQAGATHPDARQEHSKDMRSTEASYLARGLAERVETMRDAVTAVRAMRLRHFGTREPLAVGALVGLVDDEDRESACFLAPAGGGERIEAGGASFLVLTPASPLGAALAGRSVGDEVEVELPSGRRSLAIAWSR